MMLSPMRMALLVSLCIVVCSAVDQHSRRQRWTAVTRKAGGSRSVKTKPTTRKMRGSTRRKITTTAANSTLFNGTTSVLFSVTSFNGTTVDPTLLLNGTSTNGTTVNPGIFANGTVVNGTTSILFNGTTSALSNGTSLNGTTVYPGLFANGTTVDISFNGTTVAPTIGLIRTRNWPTAARTVETTTFFKPRLVTLPPHPKVVLYTIKPVGRFYEFDNKDVEEVIVIWLCFLILGCLIGFLTMFGMRHYYKKITADKLDDIKREFENQRQIDRLNIDNPKPIEPLSDPVTDQAIYYPLGDLLKEDAYGGVL